ncbi:hypothetical protein OEZ83_27045, partial [Leclercia adecarboxylata]|uniref:hypothetical protein n=1 Tax=Leclercia adecarboxylata TaxID=83655 RepID=UPI00234DCE0D
AEESKEEANHNALITDLSLRLQERGYKTQAAYSRGDSLVIPLVVGHDDIPGTWAVAVTIDDEVYALETSLRRRDEFWPAMLTSRGWTVVPTVTTSVFFSPQTEVDRIVAAVDAVRDDVRLVQQ